jgi:GH35 family endo-1,4-beta-xylanase
MKKRKEIERLENHISALETSYENIIAVLNEEIDKDDETGKVKLKDNQKKVFAEGIQKSSETADNLLKMINLRYKELEELKNPPKEEVETENKKGDANLKKVDDKDDYPLEQHLV